MPRISWDKKPVALTLEARKVLWLTFTLRDLKDAWEKDPRLTLPEIGGTIQKNLRLCGETLQDLEAAIEQS